MRYQESGDQSAELLRLALPQMARHGGVYHPTHYAVWYEYLATVNPPLKAALDGRLAEPRPLESAEVIALYRRHLATRESQHAEQFQQHLQTLLQQLGRAAESAGQGTEAFSRSLADAVGKLTADLDAEGLGRLIHELAASTEAARSSADTLHAQVAASSREIAALKEQLGELRNEAATDALTRLHNRRGFERAVAALVADRADGLGRCAVIMADIDHFKRINDSFGHLLGDQVIKGVAQIIRDTVGTAGLAARFGGEEFALLLPDAGHAEALRLAEQIRGNVTRARVRRQGTSEYLDQISISLGVACAQAGEILEQVIERADRGLYRAKESGRNRVESVGQAA